MNIVKTTNPEHGLFGNIGGSERRKNIWWNKASRYYQSEHGLTAQDAALLLDSAWGRHLADHIESGGQISNYETNSVKSSLAEIYENDFKWAKIEAWVDAAKTKGVYKVKNDLIITCAKKDGSLSVIQDGVVFKNLRRGQVCRMLLDAAAELYHQV